ncbi:MAG: hypothetical protein QNK11_07685, partial [Legionella sp.]|nr:hypothetical protein [Legionella sp.]
MQLTMKQYIRKIWYRMPLDGTGLIRFGPQISRHFEGVLIRYRWKTLPIWARPIGYIMTRFAWILICPIQTFTAVRQSRTPISWQVALYTLWLGWTRGKSPQLFIAAYPSIGTGVLAQHRRNMLVNNLDDRQGGLLFSSLASKKNRTLASDKLTCTNALIDLGLSVAPILMELTSLSQINFSMSPWMNHKKLFIKPRTGSGSQGAMSIERMDDDRFKIKRAVALSSHIISKKELFFLLKTQILKSSLIVQPFLYPSASTLDISQETPILLRIFVHRSPGGPAKHLSSAFKV